MVTATRIGYASAILLAITGLVVGCAKRDVVGFDIPAGDASVTFVEFARQANVEILFDPEIVDGVKTHSVSGWMNSVDALEIMIAETGFYIHQDPLSNAIAIRKQTGNVSIRTLPSSP